MFYHTSIFINVFLKLFSSIVHIIKSKIKQREVQNKHKNIS